jgi:hypothetical protein
MLMRKVMMMTGGSAGPVKACISILRNRARGRMWRLRRLG